MRGSPARSVCVNLIADESSGAFGRPNARKRYEFGTKVSLVTTIDEGFVVGMRSMPGDPYGGHTLSEALEQVEILTARLPRWPSWTADIAAMVWSARRS